VVQELSAAKVDLETARAANALNPGKLGHSLAQSGILGSHLGDPQNGRTSANDRFAHRRSPG
jgi:hypothetical protein